GLIGYVPQDDLLFEDLTVWENLYYAARLCFDELSKAEIEEKVSRILNELELFSFRDLKVGSPLKKVISGGQRKRLNVALELIREPAILFVDEPTSGLSSTDSEKVMHLLKQQTRKGKLVFVNIHQPSSAIFKLFDKLWIMDKGGRPIYAGNPLDAILYFKKEVNHVNADVCECAICGNVNPEQVLEIVETKMIDSSGNFTSERRFSPEYWYQLFRKNPRQKPGIPSESKAPLPQSDFRKPGLLKQFLIFFQRNLRTKLSDKQYLLINLFEAPVLAAIVAYFTRFAEGEHYIFFENKSLISYLFMSIVVILFMGMSVSAEEIIKDRKILQRESFLNLSRFSYLSAKIRFLVLLSAFQAFTFVLVGNWILGIHHMNWVYWLVLFSTAAFSNLLGLNISSAFDSVVTIYILIPLLLIPQILLCGVIVKFDDLQSKTADKDAVPFVGDVMVSRWAFEALAVEQFKSNRYMVHYFDMEKDMANARFRSDLLITELTGQIDLVSGWIRN
ncbi:MAG TPA: ABC transporter permease, partial [Prolixibacteraceae bacterium]|nr:ABC transporter permease [Prolixibacteraceae bacterium]